MIKKGDKVAFVSPSSWLDQKALKYALEWFEKKGIKVVFSSHIFDVDGYGAGDEKNRADDINKAFADKDIKAIFCTRGGAGSLKVLKYLDYRMIKKSLKPVFGLSDSTALQNALYAKTGLVSYTGFLPAYDFKQKEPDKVLEKSLLDVFNGKKIKYKNFDVLNDGEAQGELVGGCLSVFASLCGTEYFPDLKEKILLLEDVGEKTYRIDLMLEQIRLQKGFDKVKGIIFGIFEKCEPADEGDETVDEIIKKFACKADIPVVCGFNYGHIKSRVLMPIGQKIRLKTQPKLIETIDGHNQD
ncbi:MAG: LD-carboxypeptidase [Alphaproteobacteria bacterium]|nr:LD-carboxypeptidase [Alphaproteobacteria bacterium]